jgi:hypothetical protein
MIATVCGLQFEDTIEGSGELAVAGQHVSVHTPAGFTTTAPSSTAARIVVTPSIFRWLVAA